MKMKEVFQFYKKAEKLFCCPVCGSKMRTRWPASIVCKKGHCFDISKEGYINFLPNQKATKYEKELFEHRRAVFEQGYYEPLAEELCVILKELPGKSSISVVDAGCGEGYYDSFLQQKMPDAQFFAFDNMKDAVRMAAKADRKIGWFVGNLANIPIQTDSVDVVLEIFAPSNYSEFSRILKKQGCILKVVPGKGYLKELRDCIGLETKRGKQSSEKYFFSQGMSTVRKTLSYKKPVDTVMAEHFLKMTPMMFGKDASDIDVSELKELTFEFTILLGREEKKKGKKKKGKRL